VGMPAVLFGLAGLVFGLWMRRRSSGMWVQSQANGIALGGGFLVLYGLWVIVAEVLS
jgi:hypothetical protein